MGGLLYRTHLIVEHKGIDIEIPDTSQTAGQAATGLPDVIQIGKIMAAADVEKGKAIFNKCAICHTSGKGEANKVGPNLWEIVGAVAARHADFQYSSGMSKRGADGKTWSYEELYRYLYSPKSYVPGTKMAFAGLKKDEERANLIAYLRTFSDKPLPLPPVEK